MLIKYKSILSENFAPALLNMYRLELISVIILFLMISGVYFSALYPDHNWGGDFAQYLHQAINLVEGTPMGDTGYIYNRYTPGLGPQAYPVGFPLLLAPIYQLFGLDMQAFQIEIITMQLMALVIVYFLYRRALAFPTALTLLLMLALSPYVIEFKRQIMSDVPFMMFNLLFVFVIEYYYHKQDRSPWVIALAALLAFTCISIRTVGFVIVLALCSSEIVIQRRSAVLTFWSAAATISFIVLSRLLFGPSAGSYLDQFDDYDMLRPFWNVEHYLINSMSGFFAGPSLSVMDYRWPFLWLFSIPLIIYGFICRARQSNLFIEMYFLGYLAVILIWPTIQELRFLYPILPLFLLYTGIGFEKILLKIGSYTGEPFKYTLAIIVFLIIVITYSVRTPKVMANQQLLNDGPYTPDAIELFQFVKQNTNSDSVFIFYKPRVLSLYTDRAASTFPYNQPIDVQIDYINKIQVGYFIVKNDAKKYNVALIDFVKSCTASFEVVFHNDMFVIYQVDLKLLNSCTQE